jgi:hypothetical protein
VQGWPRERLAIQRATRVPNAESYASIGLQPLQNVLPAPVRNWLAAEHGVISAAW